MKAGSSARSVELAAATNAATDTRQTAGDRSRLPGVFLMIESFETGGSERQFSALARSLNPDIFRLNLGCIRRRGTFIEGLGEIPQFRLGGRLYGPQSWRTRWRLARHLRREGIALAQAFDFYSNLTLIPTARAARVPVVVGSQRQLGDLLTPAQAFAQRAAFGWCDAVVCNSQAAAHRLIDQGLSSDKIAVIANGLPDAAFAERQNLSTNHSGNLRVGMIARMNSTAKNHALFLRAAARLTHKFPEAEFILVGDGPLRSDLEKEAARLNIERHVRFLGDQKDIPAILVGLDLSVLPSASESLSNAILESMAAGVPVVASRVGGNSELVSEERGILCGPEDEGALATAIESLLLNECKRKAMGVNARKFARASFTIQQMHRRYEELYTELLARRRWRMNSRSSGASVGQKGCTSVAIIAASLRYVGGQSVQADLLLRHWKNDSEIDAIFVPIDPALPRALAWVESVPVLRTLVREPFYLRELWKGLKDADIAHIFSASYWSFLIAPSPALWIARLRGKKVLIHYHSGEARDHLRRSPTARTILRKADRLVVPSEYLVDVFHDFDLEAHPVPNIIDMSRFSFRERRPLRPHLICTRGFHPYYSIDVVVRAFAEVKKQFPEACLDLVGKGPSEAVIRGLVRKLNLSGIHFTGVASREDIGHVYDRADIFINASCVDNMPVSILEAFACGTPVVSTAAESLPYLVEHERTGLLSDVGDATALAANVVRLLRDPELAARLASQALLQSEKYRWPAVREQWLDTYRRVMAPTKEADERIAFTT